ncbi:MAG: hypothetical protein KBT47_03990, partial [Armatimonadetes bacterium]|nr:hypothetical protein [Candidatus Hippobium faecium]
FSLPVLADRVEYILHDFEDNSSTGWWVPDISSVTLSTKNTTEKAHSGKHSNKFTWDWTRNKNNDNICFGLSNQSAGIIKSVRFWVYATENEIGTEISLWATDPSGEIFATGVKIEKAGWQEYKADFPDKGSWPSGNADGIPQKPLKLTNFVVIQNNAPKVGTLYLDDVTAVCEGDPIEFVKGSFRTLGDDFNRVLGDNPQFTLSLYNGSETDLSENEYYVRIFNAYTKSEVYRKNITLSSFRQGEKTDTNFNLKLPYGLYNIVQTFKYQNNEYTENNTLALFPSICGVYGENNYYVSPKTGIFIGYNEMPFSSMTEKSSSVAKALENYMTYCGYLGGVFGGADALQSRKGGARWIRTFADNWKGIEYEKDRFDISKLHKSIKEYNSFGIRNVLLMCLYDMPIWRNPYNLDYAPAYGKLMGEIAKKTKGDLDWFELGNEDNIRLGWAQFGNIDRNKNQYYWAEVGRNGAAAVRKENATALTINSATAGVDLNWLKRHSDVIENLDIVCTHPYTGNNSPEKGRVYESGQEVFDFIDSLGGYKELWSTEFGYNDGTEGPNVLPLSIRSDYYLRNYLLQLATGYEKPGLFSWDYYWGIYENRRGTERAIAIEHCSKELEGARIAGCINRGENYVLIFEKPGSEPFAVAWSSKNPIGEHNSATYEGVPDTEYNIKYTGVVLDCFGNPLCKGGESVRLTHAPIYIHDVDRELLIKAWDNTIDNYLERANRLINLSLSHENSVRELTDELFILGKTETKAESAASYNILKAILLKCRYENLSHENISGFPKKAKDFLEKARKEGTDYPKLRWALDRYNELELERKYIQALENSSSYPEMTVSPYGNINIVYTSGHKGPGVNLGLGFPITANTKKADLYSDKIKNAENILADYALKYLTGKGEEIQSAVWAYLYYTPDGVTFDEDIKFETGKTLKMNVRVNNYSQKSETAQIRLILPEGWTASPEIQTVRLTPNQNEETYFDITPGEKQEENTVIKAVVSIEGKPDRETVFRIKE